MDVTPACLLWRQRSVFVAPPPSFKHNTRDPTRTALYQLVAEQHQTFIEAAQEDGGIPSFVEAAFERYLKCGVLAHGFARFHCGDCGHDHLVALSCKTRGLCPSCGGRRMASLTRHIMDAELPCTGPGGTNGSIVRAHRRIRSAWSCGVRRRATRPH